MKREQRLAGKRVFLSASVPKAGSGWENARLDLNVDEAVISLTRTVFAEGGQLVFGGHPSISPLVLTIASEYAALREKEEPLALIYQSAMFRDRVPEQTVMLMQLGYGEIVWTPIAEGESWNEDPVTKRPIVPKSLRKMREDMIRETSPAAFIAAGGMEGIVEEVNLFRELVPGAPVFAIATTGGASATLAEKVDGVRAIDKEIESKILEKRPDADVRPAALYPVVMEQIVQILSPRRAG